MQEMGAPQTDTDFGMAAEPNQLGLLIRRAAAPALERLGSVRPGGCCGGGHENIFLLPVQAVGVWLSNSSSPSRSRSIPCSVISSRTGCGAPARGPRRAISATAAAQPGAERIACDAQHAVEQVLWPDLDLAAFAGGGAGDEQCPV